MRVRSLAVVCALAGAAVVPAAAQAQGYYGGSSGYQHAQTYDTCQKVTRDRQVAGALMGAVVGGLIGNGVQSDDLDGEGAAVGALLGAGVGAAIGNGTSKCRPQAYSAPAPQYGYQQGYSHAGYQQAPYYGGSPSYGATSQGYGDPYYSGGLAGGPDDYGYAGRDYGGYDDAAARQCETVYRITRLPDGREVREPVRACREAYYGDWDVRN